MNPLNETSDRVIEYHFAPRLFFICLECNIHIDTCALWTDTVPRFWGTVHAHMRHHVFHDPWFR